jgi:glyoxylase-like metal-dependent hydrolase (beta-lactamase superfamily II)
MLITSSGKITDDFYVLGDPGVPVYLMDGDEPSLFDAGFTALAPLYERHIKKILGSRTPSYLFLTHSHFDHVGSASYFKKIWPGMKIAGSRRLQETLERPRALQLIRRLNREAAEAMRSWGREFSSGQRARSWPCIPQGIPGTS